MLFHYCTDCGRLFVNESDLKSCPFCGSYNYRAASEKELLENARRFVEAYSEKNLERPMEFFEKGIIHYHYFTCLMPASAFETNNGMVIEVSVEYGDPDPENDNMVLAHVWASSAGVNWEEKLFLIELEVPNGPNPDILIVEILKKSKEFRKAMQEYIAQMSICFD